MEINAMILVYFNESSRRRKDRGMTISLGWKVSLSSWRSRDCSTAGFRGSHLHKTGDPEVPINQKADRISIITEASDHSGHQIAYDD